MSARAARGRKIVKALLGASLIFAGTAHLTFAREEFQAQVPEFVPLEPDTTVVASGIAEIALGTALVVARGRRARRVGTAAALFFAAVFPGNISQYVHRRDGFGLDTDNRRLARLFFQPVLIATALWSTRR
ncbi:DoxX family protein [Leucobacter allii]|uniref:DoxX family protein n=1 Tax=Leucobacter allii TaxID=2932247 RepID=UPI001FD04D86|nr:DoxX family protein [Leucobacter allii]UOR01686.1 DoxX family protein [Leucobacter allii]